MKLKRVILYLCFCYIPLSSFAWDARGHAIVAEIAYGLLTKHARQSLHYYLNGMTIEAAATWMDHVRNDPTYGYMKTWHYINVEKDQNVDDAQAPNIITELQQVIGALQNKKSLSKAQVTTDLKILIHLIGDLHQPLHVGYGSDRGGNEIGVMYHGNRTNLHVVWDALIINASNITTASCVALYDTYSPSKLAAIRSGRTINWMQQSRSYLSRVYAVQNNQITPDYITVNTVIVKTQLIRAGIRLAEILNRILQ